MMDAFIVFSGCGAGDRTGRPYYQAHYDTGNFLTSLSFRKVVSQALDVG